MCSTARRRRKEEEGDAFQEMAEEEGGRERMSHKRIRVEGTEGKKKRKRKKKIWNNSREREKGE